MKLHLASTAELYAEHRRTGSTRKRQRIANELQRRHDELMQPPECWPLDRWYWPTGEREFVRSRFEPGGGHWEIKYYEVRRFDFALMLPAPKPSASSC